MADIYAPGFVAGAIRQGLSANAALTQFREAGGAIGRSAWLKLYAEQRTYVGGILDESTKPLNSIPSSGDTVPMTTKRASGFLQTVDIYTRIKGSSVITVKPFMHTTDQLMTRGDAVTKAVEMMNKAAQDGRYEEVVLGGVYTGTRIMTPGEVS